MSSRGTNIGTGNYISADELGSLGIKLVRLVSLQYKNDDPNQGFLNDYIQSLWNNNISVMPVITPQSNGFICWGDIYQISASGVEPDTDGTTPQQQLDFWMKYYNQYFSPNAPTPIHEPIIGPGLASGLVNWWTQLLALGGLPGAVGMDVHPYNKTASQAKALFAQYQKISPANYKLYCMEWNRPADQIPEFASMLSMPTSSSYPGPVLSAWFCQSCGVAGFDAPPRIWYACTS